MYNLDDDTAENEIPYDFENFYVEQEKNDKFYKDFSIGIFGEPTSERLTLRLILQSYGFFTRIISSQQETVSLIEDKMINLLIILPENEKEDEENIDNENGKDENQVSGSGRGDCTACVYSYFGV